MEIWKIVVGRPWSQLLVYKNICETNNKRRLVTFLQFSFLILVVIIIFDILQRGR